MQAHYRIDDRRRRWVEITEHGRLVLAERVASRAAARKVAKQHGATPTF